MPAEYGAIQIVGQEMRAWTSYEVDSSLLTPADAFKISVGPVRQELRDLAVPGAEIAFLVDDVVVLSGYVDDAVISYRKGEAELSLAGRDRMGQLVDCSAPLLRRSNISLQQLALELGSRWVSSWVGGNDVNRRRVALRPPGYGYGLVFAEYGAVVGDLAETVFSGEDLIEFVKVDPGETCWDVLDRWARKLEKFAWIAADGTGILAKPKYDQPAQYRILHFPSDSSRARENNVIEATVHRGLDERYSEVTVYGVRGAGGNDDGDRFKVTVTDADPGEVPGGARPRIVVDHDVHTRAQAEARGAREIQIGRLKGLRLEYLLRGHGQGDRLWAVDTVVEVHDEVAGIDGEYYVVERRFSKSKAEGTTTRVTLVEKGVLLP